MSVAWIVYLLITGTLLSLGARAIASALGDTGRSTRWVWAAALAGVVALGVVAPHERAPRVTPTTIAGSTPASVTLPSQTVFGVSAAIDALRAAVESGVGRAISLANGFVPAGLARPAAFAWLFASSVLLALYLVVNLKIVRARRGWPRERIQGIDVRVAPTTGPAVIGVVRAEIVVPRALLDRDVEEQRLILAHEHEHLRARDNVLLGLACAVVIALPWHPVVWYLLARLRLAIELDCDARVLRRGIARRAYGALLIDMAAHGTGLRIGTLALADRPSHLERRLLAMRNSRSRNAAVRGLVSCAVAGLLVLAACEAKVPTSAELSSMGVADLQKSAARSGVFSDARFAHADVFLDGVKITHEELLAFDAARIGSIEIVKSGRDTVIVTSRDRYVQRDSAESSQLKTRSADRSIRSERAGESRMRSAAPEGDPRANPAIVIDGQPSTERALAALSPDRIASVEVYKPKNADTAREYPNGLITVTTKRVSSVPTPR